MVAQAQPAGRVRPAFHVGGVAPKLGPDGP